MPVIRHKNEDDDMIWPPDDFTGEWIVEWPNGALKFRSLYLGGKAEGDYLCYWSNGKPAQVGYSSNGMCVGVWTDYFEDGTKDKETHYINNRTFETLWFDADGSIYESEYMIDYVAVTKAEFERFASGAKSGSHGNTRGR